MRPITILRTKNGFLVQEAFFRGEDPFPPPINEVMVFQQLGSEYNSDSLMSFLKKYFLDALAEEKAAAESAL